MPRNPWFVLLLGILLGMYAVPKLRAAARI